MAFDYWCGPWTTTYVGAAPGPRGRGPRAGRPDRGDRNKVKAGRRAARAGRRR